MTELEEFKQQMNRIEQKFDLLLDFVAVKQKDAVELAGVSKDTPRNRFMADLLDVYSHDGSSLNFVTLSSVPGLKKRRPPKK